MLLQVVRDAAERDHFGIPLVCRRNFQAEVRLSNVPNLPVQHRGEVGEATLRSFARGAASASGSRRVLVLVNGCQWFH